MTEEVMSREEREKLWNEWVSVRLEVMSSMRPGANNQYDAMLWLLGNLGNPTVEGSEAILASILQTACLRHLEDQPGAQGSGEEGVGAGEQQMSGEARHRLWSVWISERLRAMRAARQEAIEQQDSMIWALWSLCNPLVRGSDDILESVLQRREELRGKYAQRQ